MSRTLRFAFIFEVVARDRGIVHMIDTCARTTHVQEHHLIAHDPGIARLYSEGITCSLMIGWSIVEP